MKKADWRVRSAAARKSANGSERPRKQLPPDHADASAQANILRIRN
jgi:hypothetical protein